MAAQLIVLGALALLLLWAIYTYNRLVVLRNRIDNAWHQIAVQLRRRFDLIPNLEETVKGYASHERTTFEQVTKARAAAEAATNLGEQAAAQNMITAALRGLLAVAENYPELKANQNFLALQEELTATEDRIAYARQAYNDTVMMFNALMQMFPANIVASLGSFQRRDYFELEDRAAEQPVKVDF